MSDHTLKKKTITHNQSIIISLSTFHAKNTHFILFQSVKPNIQANIPMYAMLNNKKTKTKQTKSQNHSTETCLWSCTRGWIVWYETQKKKDSSPTPTQQQPMHTYLFPNECRPPPDGTWSSKNESSLPPSKSSTEFNPLPLRVFVLVGGGVLGNGGALFSKFLWFLASTVLKDGPLWYQTISLIQQRQGGREATLIFLSMFCLNPQKLVTTLPHPFVLKKEKEQRFLE